MTVAFNPARSGQPVTLNEAPDKELSTSDCRCRSHAFPPGRIVGAARQTLPREHSAGLRSATSSIRRASNALQFLEPPMGRWPMLANWEVHRQRVDFTGLTDAEMAKLGRLKLTRYLVSDGGSLYLSGSGLFRVRRRSPGVANPACSKAFLRGFSKTATAIPSKLSMAWFTLRSSAFRYSMAFLWSRMTSRCSRFYRMASSIRANAISTV
jgi:hypothetical protein